MRIEVELLLGRRRLDARPVFVPDNVLVSVFERHFLGPVQLVSQTLQIPFQFMIGQADLRQKFRK
jgi:hypothetical protein